MAGKIKGLPNEACSCAKAQVVHRGNGKREVRLIADRHCAICDGSGLVERCRNCEGAGLVPGSTMFKDLPPLCPICGGCGSVPLGELARRMLVAAPLGQAWNNASQEEKPDAPANAALQ